MGNEERSDSASGDSCVCVGVCARARVHACLCETQRGTGFERRDALRDGSSGSVQKERGRSYVSEEMIWGAVSSHVPVTGSPG